MIKRVFETDHTVIPVTIVDNEPENPDFSDIVVNIGATGDMFLADFARLAASVLHTANTRFEKWYRFPVSDDLVRRPGSA